MATSLTELVDANNLSPHNFSLTPDGRFIGFTDGTTNRAIYTTFIRLWDADTGASTLISGTSSNTVVSGSTCDSAAVDPTGQFVTFLSDASGLTTNDAAAGWHAYLRDTIAGTTTMLDVAVNGLSASASPLSLSAPVQNGRLVAFDSLDDSLVTNDRNHRSDVFLRDVVAGTTELISARHPALPSVSPNGSSVISPGALSADGRWIAFVSDADNLVPNDTKRYLDIFLRDLAAGTNALVSVATNGSCGNGPSSELVLTPDGRYVAFSSWANNLVPGDNNSNQDVFIRDLQCGTTSLVSVDGGGTVSGNQDSYIPQIGADGRFVLFRSKASNLAAGSFTGENLFLRDTQAGITYALTTAGVVSAAMTPDGLWVAFVDAAGASAGNIYVWDSLAAARVFTNNAGTGLSSVGISPDGNRVAFCGGSGTHSVWIWDRLVKSNHQVFSGGMTPTRPALRFSAAGQCLVFTAYTNQLYCYDSSSDSTVLVSKNYLTSSFANAACDSPDISADGRFIAYRSKADDLVPGDTNGMSDIFLYDRKTGLNTLLTFNRAGSSTANSLSFAPVFSGDGRTLFFASWAADPVANDFNQQSDIFAYSLFYALILPGAFPGEGVWIWWPATSGQDYRVQFKNKLDDPIWQDLGGSITNIANRAGLKVPALDAAHRFYRVVSF
jgi:Tol biopolymer transport system component